MIPKRKDISVAVGLLTLKIYLPYVHSLKEKRHSLLPLQNRIRKKYNVSIAETDAQDAWHSSILTCAVVNSQAAAIQAILQQMVTDIEQENPEIIIESEVIEIL
ncbi:MAG: DUF503 domain-containing protein [Anaerolineae bacterium]|nr:DUF503 domain-containing protein [Anaerolineae bacterium]